MAVFADVAHGHVDAADIFFLIAVILFIIAAVIAFIEKSIFTVLICAGLACTALAWLLL